MKAPRGLGQRVSARAARRIADRPPRMTVARTLGVPAIFAVALSAVAASIYFMLGVVAGDALGLTPLAFVLAAVFFVITMLTYVEGNSLHPERGGASNFARYAFDELWSFIAGWAILLDYLIVMAIGAFTISHYLGAFWGQAGRPGVELAIAAAAIGFVVWSNIRGLSANRLNAVLWVGLANLILLMAVIVAGLVIKFDADLILDSIDVGRSPEVDDFVFAAVLAGAGVVGIEAASGLAGEVRAGTRELRRVVVVGSAVLIAVFIGISVVAMTAVPVIAGSTALGDRWVEAPVLGIVSAFEPAWLRDVFRYAVGLFAALVLATAVNGSMLGLSRLTYSLATNRQIPSAVGKLHPVRSTPYVAISISGVLAFALTLSTDVDFLAGIFAFGALIAFTLAHVSVVVLRYREPERRRAFQIPLSFKLGEGWVPIPAVVGAVAGLGAWVSVLVLHEGARVVGLLWMVAGITLYVIYRRGQDKPLAKRFTIPAQALKEAPEIQYGSILVPVFGGPLDDDIIGTAGRLAAEEGVEGEGGAVIEAIYVLEIPVSLPLDARVPDEQIQSARRALGRAKEVGEEYAGVEVATATARARSVGAGIVEEARRRGVEVIVLAAEQPTRLRGGALLGGLGGPRDRAVGEVTRYVVEKAPCRVILTAAPPGEVGEREGVAP